MGCLSGCRPGSSPRMRGAPQLTLTMQSWCRIIPADAGSTHYKSCAHVSPWDHPRGCGEHPMLRPASLWGPGIIPADAGSTSGKSNVIAESEDHPRGCGEHDNAVRIGIHQVGSSPRMRGAPTHNAPRSYDSRIIPADAGSTTPQSGRIPGKRDHPRGCGEHQLAQDQNLTNSGSSPRMRGALTGYYDLRPNGRIIPADAGSTMLSPVLPSYLTDHPRGCGEHRTDSSIRVPPRGSSPRMRGALKRMAYRRIPKRIIPADAGSTPTFSGVCAFSGDHPRGCGEHDVKLTQDYMAIGSSPRMRGALPKDT